MRCICCGSVKIKSLGKLRRYPYFKCCECGFRFIYPIPTQNELETFYTKTRVIVDLKEIIKKLIRQFDELKKNPKRDWFDFVLGKAAVLSNKKRMKILEVGSGYGYFVHHASNKGHDVTGTEITEEYAEASSAVVGGKIKQADALSLADNFKGQQFDLIYLEHVFEHLPEPSKTIEQLRKLLHETHGTLIVSVPNSASLLSKLQGKFWPWACPPEHLFFYSPASLSKLLQASGFTVLESFTGDFYFRSIPQLYSLLPLINYVRRKVLKKPNIPYHYEYPRSIGKILLLIPYWLLWPFLKVFRNAGNELIVICKKSNA